MDFNKIKEKTTAFFLDPQKVFLLALAITIFCTGCYTLFFTDIYRDTAGVYAMYARELARGNWFAGIVTRAPMLNITLAGALGYCGMETIAALTLVSGGFYIAALYPLRKLLLRYLSPLAAAYGCLLYATAPKLITFFCAALLESSRCFFLLAAVLYFLNVCEKPGWKNSLLFGVSSGFLMVSRGEGLPVGIVLLAGAFIYGRSFCRRVSWKQQLAACGFAIFIAVLVITPFCMMNYAKTGYFVTDMRIISIAGIAHSQLEAAGKSTPQAVQSFTSGEEGNRNWGEKTASIFSGMWRGGYELYWVLAAIGIILMFKRGKWRSDHLLFAGVTLMQVMMYFVIVSSYRYYIFMIPLFMCFTVSGASWLLAAAKKYLPGKMTVLLCAVCAVVIVLQIINGTSRAFKRKSHPERAVAAWVARYEKEKFSGSKLRLLAVNLPEVAYWSKAIYVNGYESGHHKADECRDFDLGVIKVKHLPLLCNRSDIEFLPGTPYPDKIAVFKLTSPGK